MIDEKDMKALEELRKHLAGALQAVDIMLGSDNDCSILIYEIGLNKINVIKAVREITNWGLKDSKDYVESAPTKLKTKDMWNMNPVAATEKLEQAGASVRLCRGKDCDSCNFRFKCFTAVKW
jgi:ribosomal protein L7/L12